jgi:hypothetical protein
MKSNVKHDLVEIDGEECWCIKIKDGDYADVIYKYNHVSAIPSDDEEYATIKFNYEVLYHAEMPDDKFSGNELFENMIGDILYDLIEDSHSKKTIE